MTGLTVPTAADVLAKLETVRATIRALDRLDTVAGLPELARVDKLKLPDAMQIGQTRARLVAERQSLHRLHRAVTALEAAQAGTQEPEPEAE